MNSRSRRSAGLQSFSSSSPTPCPFRWSRREERAIETYPFSLLELADTALRLRCTGELRTFSQLRADVAVDLLAPGVSVLGDRLRSPTGEG
ncbi:hypothetical protein [Cryobacterium sp. Y50]|uniref:hypothetical protein n=1 Tax=Cryobacterium sp. Y50 TaxID=2048286 RepID=UPI001304E5CC|nr:hypothetical protein [Cryobacterium sp. Y50]